METKELKPKVYFVTGENKNGLAFYAVYEEDGRILYETNCPVTTGMLIVKYWMYCTAFKEMRLLGINDFVVRRGEFFEADIRASLAYFDVWDFLTVFSDLGTNSKLHYGIEIKAGLRRRDALRLFKEDKIYQLVDDLYRCKTMGDIIVLFCDFFDVEVSEVFSCCP